VYQVYFEQHKLKPDTLKDMPTFTRIYWVPICSAFCLFACKKQIANAAKPIIHLVGKDQNDKELQDARVEKASLALYKFCYYTGMSIWGYIILKDSAVFPTWLGGTGSLKNCFIAYPFAP